MKIIFLFLVFGMNLLSAQHLSPIDSIRLDFDGHITDFGTDDFNNIYFIKNSIELNKIDLKTAIKKTFSNRNVLEDLNTQNILQLTLKSGFFNLLILDSQLNPIQDPISLNSSADFSPALISLVDNNYLWGYDPILQRLILWNYREKKIVRQSMILSNQSASEFFSKLIYDSNSIYLVGNDKILKFDEFANLNKVIPIEAHNHLLILGKFAFYSKDGEILRLDLKTDQTETIASIGTFDFFSLNKSYLFVLKNKVVYLYKPQNIF